MSSDPDRQGVKRVHDARQRDRGSQRIIAELRQERDAALAREAALAEVLGVINRSPGDPGPVFEAILEKAHSLCGADLGARITYDGVDVQAVVSRGYLEAAAALVRGPSSPSPAQQTLIARRTLPTYPRRASCRIWTGSGVRGRHRRNHGLSHLPHGPSVQGRCSARLPHRAPPGGASILGTRHRAARKFRSLGRDHGGGRAADHRAARGVWTGMRHMAVAISSTRSLHDG
jgi:hypothetical protein